MAFNPQPPWFFSFWKLDLTSLFFTLPNRPSVRCRRLQGWAEPSKVLSVSALESFQQGAVTAVGKEETSQPSKVGRKNLGRIPSLTSWVKVIEIPFFGKVLCSTSQVVVCLGFLKHPTVSVELIRDIGAWLSVKSFIWGHQKSFLIVSKQEVSASRPCAGRWRLAFPCHGEFDRKSDQRSLRTGCDSWERLWRRRVPEGCVQRDCGSGKRSDGRVRHSPDAWWACLRPAVLIVIPLVAATVDEADFSYSWTELSGLQPFTRSKTQAVSNVFFY